MNPDKRIENSFLKIMMKVRDLEPLEDEEIIHIQDMTKKEKTELIICMNETIRSLVYVLNI